MHTSYIYNNDAYCIGNTSKHNESPKKLSTNRNFLRGSILKTDLEFFKNFKMFIIFGLNPCLDWLLEFQ